MANTATVKDNTIKIGDQIKVYYTFKDGEKTKQQIFAGIVIMIKGDADNKMFTVRKVGKDKIGIERIFPTASPYIEKVETVKSANPRRAKLYFIRKISDRTLRDRLY